MKYTPGRSPSKAAWLSCLKLRIARLKSFLRKVHLEKVLSEVFGTFGRFLKSGLCGNYKVAEAEHLQWLQDLPEFLKDRRLLISWPQQALE